MGSSQDLSVSVYNLEFGLGGGAISIVLRRRVRLGISIVSTFLIIFWLQVRFPRLLFVYFLPVPPLSPL